MTATSSDTAWQSEFGIGATRQTSFFGSVDDLDSRDTSIPHAHVVRRAFHLLDLDGVLCDQASPLVYFKVIPQIQPANLLKLYRRFWNHGGAPILVVVSPDEIQIYSGLARPTDKLNAAGQPADIITTINRASSQLREFLPSVESGEFFRKHSKSFKPTERVDRALLDNLKATRENLSAITARKATTHVLDAFLCRLVFTCYLFDRGIITENYLRSLGFPALSRLQDILGLRPRLEAKAALYRLFRKLAKDFNGDMFSDDLSAETALISAAHIEEVDTFFRGTDVKSGQQAFWSYDFEAIPIETISAIYERFLNSSDREIGAFYTPRFLAELVLDIALSKRPSLLGLRFLDPACGSGIFLVGLFNRMAEEWKQANPEARNDRRARELMKLLQSSIFGIDSNPTACRIAAFSLYLAYLDQLSPRDIQELQAKGQAQLPRLVKRFDQSDIAPASGGIWCGDFFQEDASYLMSADLVVGNPPWGSIAEKGSAAAKWLNRHHLNIPNRQIAAAFMWKTVEHVAQNGRVCLVLPHGILFNHERTALSFQQSFIRKHALDRVLNLTDYQSFLFSEARHPALVLGFRRGEPDKDHTTEYWAPKADWKALKAEIISVSEQDRSTLTLRSILEDLDGKDAPQIWKRMAWATARDRRLLDRLSELPRLRDHLRQAREKDTNKPWLIAEGFQPFGENDPPSSRRRLQLPTRHFVPATSEYLQLFLLPDDCETRPSTTINTRRFIRDVQIFRGPHILVAKGFGSIAFADFDVSFRHALRGIAGPQTDRNLLIFLAAYMRSPLAQYFQFHTSSNWGVSRQEVHVEELLRLPFPLPEALDNPARGEEIVKEVASIVQSATRKARDLLVDRDVLVDETQAQLNPLIYEYFDVVSSERVLVEDTVHIAAESFRPSPHRRSIPAIEPSTSDARDRYTNRLCMTLNAWARGGRSRVIGSAAASQEMGVGLVILEKINGGHSRPIPSGNRDLLAALDKLRDAVSIRDNTFELARGIKVFDGPRLYLVKPLDFRYWSETAALNDADEIAGSILMQSSEKFA